MQLETCIMDNNFSMLDIKLQKPLVHERFSSFLNCTNGTESRQVSHTQMNRFSDFPTSDWRAENVTEVDPPPKKSILQICILKRSTGKIISPVKVHHGYTNIPLYFKCFQAFCSIEYKIFESTGKKGKNGKS